MNKLQFQVERQDVLDLVQADDDVAVKGWDEDYVELDLDGEVDDCQVEQREGALVINSRIPLAVSVPYEMRVHIGQVRGDLVVSELENELSVDDAVGNCDLRSNSALASIDVVRGDLNVEETMGTLTVGQVRADVRLTNIEGDVELGDVGDSLRARGIEGALKLGTVQGDARVRDAAGVVIIGQVRGDFRGTDLRGGMQVRAEGDVSLKTALVAGAEYTAYAQGDISARVPANASAHFTLRARGGISTRLLRVEEMASGCVEGQMGDGKAKVVLESERHLSLKPSEELEGEFGAFGEFADFGASIAAQVEAQIAEQLQGMRFDDLARTEMEKAMAKLERDKAAMPQRAEGLSRKAQERARKAQERIKHTAERAARHAQQHSRRFQVHIDAERVGRRAAPKGVSQEEQLSILRMLQEGKISAEEAEMLLKALEGQGGS